eukprot:94472_1
MEALISGTYNNGEVTIETHSNGDIYCRRKGRKPAKGNVNKDSTTGSILFPEVNEKVRFNFVNGRILWSNNEIWIKDILPEIGTDWGQEFGGNGGRAFSKLNTKRKEKRITGVRLVGGKFVHSIQWQVDNVWQGKHGGDGGKYSFTFLLQKDEWFSHVDVRSGLFIDYIRLSTNKSRHVDVGGNGGSPNSEGINQILVDCKGRCGDFVDQLQFMWVPDNKSINEYKADEKSSDIRQGQMVEARVEWIKIPKDKGEVYFVDDDDDTKKMVVIYTVPDKDLRTDQSGIGKYAIGKVCKSHKSDTLIPVIVGQKGVHVAKPVRCVKIWDDRGCGNIDNYQLWRPIPPKGFVSLSDIPQFHIKVSNDLYYGTFEGIWCVSEKLVEIANIYNCVWSTKGIKMNAKGSIWSIKDTRFMAANIGWKTPKEAFYKLDFEGIRKRSKNQRTRCRCGQIMKLLSLGDYQKQENINTTVFVCNGCNNSIYESIAIVWCCSENKRKCKYKFRLCSDCGVRKENNLPLYQTVLRSGESLKAGEYLAFRNSAGIKTKLILQTDGNLCLYYDHVLIWHIPIEPNGELIMAKNGNICLYNSKKQLVWKKCGTRNKGACKLKLGEGNVYLCNDNNNGNKIWSAIRRIKNPHIVIIGIQKYESPNEDLGGIPKDVEKMRNLWSGYYSFNNISFMDYKHKIKLKDIEKFVEYEAKKIENDNFVDGLIFIYSGHGSRYKNKDYIICSDGNAASKIHLMNMFNDQQCSHLKGKPKLFYFDCCRGHKGISVDQLNSAKGNKVHSIQTDDEKLDICDYLVHYSSAPEYQSYQTGEGSYLIDAIYEKYKTHKELVSITKDIQETVIKKSGNTEMAPIHNALKKNLYLIDYNEKFSVETIYETTDASINSNRNDDGRVHGNENDIISKELAHVKLSDDKTTLIVNPIAGSAKNTDNYGAFTIKSFHVSCSSDTINTPIMQDMMGIVFYYWFDNMNTDTNRKGQQYEYFTFAGNTCQPAYILLVNSSRLAPGKKNKKTDPISGSTYHGKAFNYWTGEKWEDQKFNGLICGGFAIQNGKYKFNSATFNIPSYDGYHDVGFHQDKNTAAYVQGNQRFLKEMSDKECVCIKAALDNWKKYKTSKQNTYVTEIASSEEWKRKFG